MPLNKMETEVVECPFVTVPLNVLDDRLLGEMSSARRTCARMLLGLRDLTPLPEKGSVDVEESVKQGKTVFEVRF